MTTNRNTYLYQFQGQILKKRLAQASPHSKYAGQPYYVLNLQLLDQTRQSIQVFPTKLAQQQIWTTIEQSQCFSKKYLFRCRNQRGYYYLVDWEELKPEPTTEKPELTERNDYELN